MEPLTVPRDAAQALLNRLGPDASFDDIQYELYVLEKLSRGLDDAREGRVVPHAQVKDDLRRWLK